MSDTIEHMATFSLSNRGAMTVREFCGWASISRSKFYQEVQSGRIRPRKIGRKTVIVWPDAIAWLDALPYAEEATTN